MILRWCGNALLLLSALGISLGGFELVLRLALPQKLYRYPRDLFRNDPEIGFVLSPGFTGELSTAEFHTHLAVSTLGFRNREVSKKPAGARRVLVVGDSFVSGLNVEADETFVAVAERTLQRELGPGRIELVNAGVPNYGTWNELGVIRRFVSTLEADLVVLCVFVGNDLDDNLNPREAVVRDGYLVKRTPTPGLLPQALRSWLQRHSMTYVFLWNAWDHARAIVQGRQRDALGGFGELVSPGPYERVEAGYRESRAILVEAAGFLSQREIPLLVVVIPQEIQVYPERFAALVSRSASSAAAGADLALPNRRWSELAGSLGLAVLDLLPTLREGASGPPLYMSLDGHLTVEGNRLAGEAIAQALVPLIRDPGRNP